jgi:hypothetical protein
LNILFFIYEPDFQIASYEFHLPSFTLIHYLELDIFVHCIDIFVHFAYNIFIK